MAYGVEIAGGYRAVSGFAGQARQDTAYVTGLQREATRQGERHQDRVFQLAETFLKDPISDMASGIAYMTGGYKLDQAVQMKKLDVAADVQKRLADEAVAAGSLVGFDMGPTPDQAIEEVGNRSAESGGVFNPSFGSQEGSVEGLSPDGRTSTEESIMRPSTGPTQPPVDGQDVTSDYQPEEGGQYDPSQPMPSAPKRGQDPSANVSAVRGRSASGRPPVPKRAPHTNVGTTEFFVNPTTGGMYARTARGLTVPISEKMFSNLISLQQANAERHYLNQTADYKNSLANWYDALTAEQKAANSAMSGELIDSHVESGLIDEGMAEAMKRAARAGVPPEDILKIINLHRSGSATGSNKALEALFKSTAYQYESQEEKHADRIKNTQSELNDIRKQRQALLEGALGSISNMDESTKETYDWLGGKEKEALKSMERSRNFRSVYGAISSIRDRPVMHVGQLIPGAQQDMFNLAFSKSDNQNVATLTTEDIDKMRAEWKWLHGQFGMAPPDRDSNRVFLRELGRRGADQELLEKVAKGMLSIDEVVDKELEESGVTLDDRPSASMPSAEDSQNFTNDDAWNVLRSDLQKNLKTSQTDELSSAFNKLAPAFAERARAVDVGKEGVPPVSPEEYQLVMSILSASSLEEAESLYSSSKFNGIAPDINPAFKALSFIQGLVKARAFREADAQRVERGLAPQGSSLRATQDAWSQAYPNLSGVPQR